VVTGREAVTGKPIDCLITPDLFLREHKSVLKKSESLVDIEPDQVFEALYAI
jgi:hypothetical protein